MPTHVASIGSIAANRWPTPDEIRGLFYEYSPRAFSPRGVDAATFFRDGAFGTEGLPFLKGRFDVSLAVYDDPQYGMALLYECIGGPTAKRYYSIGNPSRLEEEVQLRSESWLHVGLFIDPKVAWLAVEDLLLTDGARSKRIAWINDDDLPPLQNAEV